MKLSQSPFNALIRAFALFASALALLLFHLPAQAEIEGMPPPPPNIPVGPLPPVDEAMSAEKKAAIDDMLATQHVDQAWPQLVKQMSAAGTVKIKGSLDAELTKHKELSKARRKELTAYIESLAPAATADMDQALLQLDVKQVLRDMGYFVYGKYLTTDEIRQMTAQYNNPTWLKLQRLQPTIQQEGRGKPAGEVMTKYFNAQELHELLNITRSPVSLKLTALQPQLRAESKVYYDKAAEVPIGAVADKYITQLKAKIASLHK
ncbi:MAG TPA: hypothetical protein VIF60_10885 [Burkholderiaceae bacterium]|jgi:hypothetical protein